MLKKGLLCGPARYVRTIEAFPGHERHPLGVSTLFSSFSLTNCAYFQNIALFQF